MRVCLDSFSGAASDLKLKMRAPENVRLALLRDPRVSCWDMSEHGWLRDCIRTLTESGEITEDKTAAYPWCRYTVNGQGRVK